VKSKVKITVVGTGYVGMSLSVLLSQYNEVLAYDIDSTRVDQINNGESTIADNDVSRFLGENNLSLRATDNKDEAYKGAAFIVICTPTDYNIDNNKFDTSSVDKIVREALSANDSALVVIKSTVPVGYTEALQKKFNTNRIVFSPEFLREGRALRDNLEPSRIVIGSDSSESRRFGSLLEQGAIAQNIQKLFVGSSEAEAIKLFANTFLAMRVSFFNELDSFALSAGLDSRSIIDGVSMDERIGAGYNNPSFGYGGYCLPKDTRQLLANYEKVPQNLIQAIVTSNSTRKGFIADEILKKKPNIVGFYLLAMKEGSDNFRSSAIQGIMKRIRAKGVTIVIFEPSIVGGRYFSSDVMPSLEEFKRVSDIIVANRMSDKLSDVKTKVFTRDIYREN